MANSPETSDYRCGLDLLQGRQIKYANHADLTNQTNTNINQLPFTEKCAFAVTLTDRRVDAVSFPVVKKASWLWDFTAVHSDVLRNIVREIASSWESSDHQ